ncbi:ABC transporter ATP-binding protein [Terasakiella sp.]|uniref:ABC transporter ATP-binding protein n=1 Tax=Terasakiella sp. TaxID=2034861 RepID=UPI003AA9377F
MFFFKFLELAGPDRSCLIRAILYKICESFFAALPFGVGYVCLNFYLDGGYAQELLPFALTDRFAPLYLAILLLVLYGVQWLCFWRTNVNAYAAGNRINTRLRLRLMSHLCKLPLGYTEAKGTGETSHVLMQDVMALEQVPGLILPRFVFAVTFPFFAAVLVFSLDYRLGLALVSGLPFAILVLVWGHRSMANASEKLRCEGGVLNARLLEFIRGIAVIKAFGLLENRENRCFQAAKAFQVACKHMTFRYVMPTLVFPVFLLTGICALVLLSASDLLAGQMTASLMFLYFFLGLRLFSPFLDLMDFSALVRQTEGALKRVLNILDQPIEQRPQMAVSLRDHAVSFEQVCFSYEGQGEGARQQLEQVSFFVPQGHNLGIVGYTGAGKSTIAKLLCGHYSATSGQIQIGDVDIRDLPRDQLNDLVCYISQQVVLFSDSVRNNISLGRAHVGEEDVIKAAKAARCHDLIMGWENGYDTVLQSAGAQLSGGERQRIALARAFLQDSPILIMDEITSAMDIENERLVQQALSELAKEKTVIVIAHRLWTLKEQDEIIVLEKGRLIEKGSHEDLLSQATLYKRFWEMLRETKGWGHIAS